jgi:hypothetical protein
VGQLSRENVPVGPDASLIWSLPEARSLHNLFANKNGVAYLDSVVTLGGRLQNATTGGVFAYEERCRMSEAECLKSAVASVCRSSFELLGVQKRLCQRMAAQMGTQLLCKRPAVSALQFVISVRDAEVTYDGLGYRPTWVSNSVKFRLTRAIVTGLSSRIVDAICPVALGHFLAAIVDNWTYIDSYLIWLLSKDTDMNETTRLVRDMEASLSELVPDRDETGMEMIAGKGAVRQMLVESTKAETLARAELSWLAFL